MNSGKKLLDTPYFFLKPKRRSHDHHDLLQAGCITAFLEEIVNF